jgi:hypothetical protein
MAHFQTCFCSIRQRAEITSSSHPPFFFSSFSSPYPSNPQHIHKLHTKAHTNTHTHSKKNMPPHLLGGVLDSLLQKAGGGAGAGAGGEGGDVLVPMAMTGLCVIGGMFMSCVHVCVSVYVY